MNDRKLLETTFYFPFNYPVHDIEVAKEKEEKDVHL